MKDNVFKVLSVCLLLGCNVEIEDPIDPDNDENGTTEAVDYLVLNSAQKRNAGLPPAATPTNILLNVEDTLYLMEDDPYLARVAMRHDPQVPISGFNVAIVGLDDYHYYVPRDNMDAADSVSVIYVGIIPGITNQPIVKVKIQPVDDTNSPITTVEIPVKPENPESSTTPALTDPEPGTDDPGGIWKWMYTRHYEYESIFVRQFLAPKQNLPTSPGPILFPGCCVDGVSVRVGDAMGVYGICSDTSALYRQIPYVPSYSHIDFEILMLNPTSFNQFVSSYIFNFYPAESNMCTEEAAYFYQTTVYTRNGTHNYTKGATRLNFTINFSDPRFGPSMPFGDIKYTQNILVITLEREGLISRFVYQRFDGPLEFIEIDEEVHHWFDHGGK